METSELQKREKSTLKKIARKIRKPRKPAPAPESLRGWAKSSLRSRRKS